MNPPLKEIVCPSCHLKQAWRGQSHCTSCGAKFSNWNIAVQLHYPRKE